MARTLGVRYRITVAERQRNDPGAKPACGTPRARRWAAAVVSSLVSWWRSPVRQEPSHGLERGTGGLQADGPEATTPSTTIGTTTPPGDPLTVGGKEKQNKQ